MEQLSYKPTEIKNKDDNASNENNQTVNPVRYRNRMVIPSVPKIADLIDDLDDDEVSKEEDKPIEENKSTEKSETKENIKVREYKPILKSKYIIRNKIACEDTKIEEKVKFEEKPKDEYEPKNEHKTKDENKPKDEYKRKVSFTKKSENSSIDENNFTEEYIPEKQFTEPFIQPRYPTDIIEAPPNVVASKLPNSVNNYPTMVQTVPMQIRPMYRPIIRQQPLPYKPPTYISAYYNPHQSAYIAPQHMGYYPGQPMMQVPYPMQPMNIAQNYYLPPNPEEELSKLNTLISATKLLNETVKLQKQMKK